MIWIMEISLFWILQKYVLENDEFKKDVGY